MVQLALLVQCIYCFTVWFSLSVMRMAIAYRLCTRISDIPAVLTL